MLRVAQGGARAAAGRCHSAWWPQWQCPGCSVRGCRHWKRARGAGFQSPQPRAKPAAGGVLAAGCPARSSPAALGLGLWHSMTNQFQAGCLSKQHLESSLFANVRGCAAHWQRRHCPLASKVPEAIVLVRVTRSPADWSPGTVQAQVVYKTQALPRVCCPVSSH